MHDREAAPLRSPRIFVFILTPSVKYKEATMTLPSQYRPNLLPNILGRMFEMRGAVDKCSRPWSCRLRNYRASQLLTPTHRRSQLPPSTLDAPFSTFVLSFVPGTRSPIKPLFLVHYSRLFNFIPDNIQTTHINRRMTPH